MAEHTHYSYVIVGAGLAGASAAKAIRERDTEGTILIIGCEQHYPYHRPPLSKSLWKGSKEVKDAFVESPSFYEENGIRLRLATMVTGVDTVGNLVVDDSGHSVGFGKLLLATGGVPRILPVPGGDDEAIVYYRYLDEYMRLKERVKAGASAVVIGGGFIGSEMAAAFAMNDARTTLLFPEPYICARIFPEALGKSIQRTYADRGVEVLPGDAVEAIERRGERFITLTRAGRRLESDLVVGGIGIDPELHLARSAGLAVDNGVVVNQYLQTSNPDIYAAGDNALFPYPVLGRRRIEHWDNACSQGAHAGANMAGANQPFTYLPYFYSDLFDWGYEAVGNTDARLETVADWEEENSTGIIYYLKEDVVKGVMLCNVWEKVDEARDLVLSGKKVTAAELRRGRAGVV
jgi:3-phenylpropionate/trans-cinnamate dioxygenase ferredoxin reductase component